MQLRYARHGAEPSEAMRLLEMGGMDNAMALRRWDDRAKVYGVEVPGLNGLQTSCFGPSPVELDPSEISYLGVAHIQAQLHQKRGTTQGEAPQNGAENG